MEEFQELMTRRVHAGMAWLDEHYPNHAARVDLGIFRIESPTKCALAQAAGCNYLDAALSHRSLTDTVWSGGRRMPRLRVLGFCVLDLESDEIEILNRIWIEAYRARREPSQM